MEHICQSYFFHTDLKIFFFPPPFQDGILIMEIWNGLLMSSFYQKQQGFLLDRERPVRGKEDLLSLWPRAQRNGTPQFKPQEAHRTLLMLFSLHRDGSQPARPAASSLNVLLPNEAATFAAMQNQSKVNLVSLMPENQFLQNVHLPCCRYTSLVNCTSLLRMIACSHFCYRRYLGISDGSVHPTGFTGFMNQCTDSGIITEPTSMIWSWTRSWTLQKFHRSGRGR